MGPSLCLDLRGQSTAVALSPRGKNATGQFVSVCDIPDNTQDKTLPPTRSREQPFLSRKGAGYQRGTVQVGRTRRSVIETLAVGERKRSSFWLVWLHANLPLFREKKFQHKISRATLPSFLWPRSGEGGSTSVRVQLNGIIYAPIDPSINCPFLFHSDSDPIIRKGTEREREGSSLPHSRLVGGLAIFINLGAEQLGAPSPISARLSVTTRTEWAYPSSKRRNARKRSRDRPASCRAPFSSPKSR